VAVSSKLSVKKQKKIVAAEAEAPVRVKQEPIQSPQRAVLATLPPAQKPSRPPPNSEPKVETIPEHAIRPGQASFGRPSFGQPSSHAVTSSVAVGSSTVPVPAALSFPFSGYPFKPIPFGASTKSLQKSASPSPATLQAQAESTQKDHSQPEPRTNTTPFSEIPVSPEYRPTTISKSSTSTGHQYPAPASINNALDEAIKNRLAKATKVVEAAVHSQSVVSEFMANVIRDQISVSSVHT
jgi:hypothetical protein